MPPLANALNAWVLIALVVNVENARDCSTLGTVINYNVDPNKKSWGNMREREKETFQKALKSFVGDVPIQANLKMRKLWKLVQKQRKEWRDAMVLTKKIEDRMEVTWGILKKEIFVQAEKVAVKIPCGSYSCKNTKWPWEILCTTCQADYNDDPDAYK